MRREWLAVAPFLSRRRADVHDCVGDLLRAARPSPSLHCFSQHGAFPYIEHNPPTPAPSKSLQPLSLRFPCRSAFRRDALLHDSNFHVVVPALRQAQERPDFVRAETQCHCSSHCWASLRGAPWVPSRATIRTRRANHSNSICRSAFRRDAFLHVSDFHIVVAALRLAQDWPDFVRAETR